MRNNIIATVVGGLILAALLAALSHVWAPARLALVWLWGLVVTVWGALMASYQVPGWLLLMFGFFAASFIVRATSAYLRSKSSLPPYRSYTSEYVWRALVLVLERRPDSSAVGFVPELPW